MEHLPVEERTEFPHAGARARQWRRFEDALATWLTTPEGHFATWCAQREIAADDALAAPRS
jgi:hypothetical protein